MTLPVLLHSHRLTTPTSFVPKKKKKKKRHGCKGVNQATSKNHESTKDALRYPGVHETRKKDEKTLPHTKVRIKKLNTRAVGLLYEPNIKHTPGIDICILFVLAGRWYLPRD